MTTPRHLRAIPTFAAAVAFAAATASAAEFPTSFKFQFGRGHAAPGYTSVPLSTAYSDSTGYGFEPSLATTSVQPAATTATTAPSPLVFSVKVPEGNYRVTVTLGDQNAATVTTVKAESRRLMLERTRTRSGEFVTKTFLVNVRSPKLADGSYVDLDSREMNLTTHEAISRDWDDRLTLEFGNEHPAVATLDIERVDHAVTFFITGDSTVTDQPPGRITSWGQMATRWFKPPVVVANHAESGETLKGFLKERRWQKVLEAARPGDYVLIEFGTNDSKVHGPQNIYPGQDFSETYAPAETTYKQLLRRFVAEARMRGVRPMIASPSARRGETKEPTSLEPWAKAAMEVAHELGVPGIDLNTMGIELNRALGADADKQFNDRTHHVAYGAYLQAKCIVLGIQQSRLPLARYITDDFRFDPAHPAPTPTEFDLPQDPAPSRKNR